MQIPHPPYHTPFILAILTDLLLRNNQCSFRFPAFAWDRPSAWNNNPRDFASQIILPCLIWSLSAPCNSNNSTIYWVSCICYVWCQMLYVCLFKSRFCCCRLFFADKETHFGLKVTCYYHCCCYYLPKSWWQNKSQPQACSEATTLAIRRYRLLRESCSFHSQITVKETDSESFPPCLSNELLILLEPQRWPSVWEALLLSTQSTPHPHGRAFIACLLLC